MSHGPEGHTRNFALVLCEPGCHSPYLLCHASSPSLPSPAAACTEAAPCAGGLLSSAIWFVYIDFRVMAFHEIHFDWENKLFSHLGAGGQPLHQVHAPQPCRRWFPITSTSLVGLGPCKNFHSNAKYSKLYVFHFSCRKSAYFYSAQEELLLRCLTLSKR